MEERDDSGGSPAPPPAGPIMFKKTARKFDASVFTLDKLPPRPEGEGAASASTHPAQPSAAPFSPGAEPTSPLSPTSPPVVLDTTGVIFERSVPKRNASVFAMSPSEFAAMAAKNLPPEVMAQLEAEAASSSSLPPVPNENPDAAHRPTPFDTAAPPAATAAAAADVDVGQSAFKAGAYEAGTPHYFSSLGALGSGDIAPGGGGADPDRASNVMSDIARQLRNSRKDPGKSSLFGKGEAAATALAAVASILGSAVLQAILTPSEIIFQRESDETVYPYSFCGDGTHATFCGRMRVTYSIACIITLIFELLCLLATIIVTIGMNSW
jgi:hypothetical protein